MSQVRPAPADRSDLDRTLMGGLVWTGAAKWLAQAVSWVSTLVIARLLTPDDYGLVGMATVYIGLVSLINEFGLGAAIVTMHKLSQTQLDQINSVSVLFGIASFVFSCIAAVPVSLFYGIPELRWVIIIMSTAFVVSAFRCVPYSVLQRDLKFKLIAKLEGVQVLLQSICTVVFAVVGLGYWTLVLGSLVGALIGTLLIFFSQPLGFAVPNTKSLREAMKVSRNVFIGRLAWYTYSNADFLVAGKFLGKMALGFYTFAWTLSSMPVEKISVFTNQVTFPFFSSVQSDYAAMRHYFLKITEALALLTFPVAIGLALVSREFVLLALGEKWKGAIAPLQLLAIYGSFRSITPMLTQILFATGESQSAMLYNLVAAVLLPVAFFYGSSFGTVGIAAAWLVVHPFIALSLYRRVFKTIGLSGWSYLQGLWPALSCTGIMAATVLAIQFLLGSARPLSVRFTLEVACGLGTYVLAVLSLHRGRVVSFLQFVRSLRS